MGRGRRRGPTCQTDTRSEGEREGRLANLRGGFNLRGGVAHVRCISLCLSPLGLFSRMSPV